MTWTSGRPRSFPRLLKDATLKSPVAGIGTGKGHNPVPFATGRQRKYNLVASFLPGRKSEVGWSGTGAVTQCVPFPATRRYPVGLEPVGERVAEWAIPWPPEMDLPGTCVAIGA
jgi:hypothetical protein